jgi:hypothetical protein
MTSPRLVWSESVEVAKRRQRPEQYWCVRDDTGVQYFWEQRRRSREEYLAHSGKEDCE